MKDGAPIILLVIGVAAGFGLGAMFHNGVIGIAVAIVIGVGYGASQYFLHPRPPAPTAEAPAKED
ncbi:MAG: hypothetical protein ABI740_11050 [Alphaproteobacteria bacterium]